MNRKKSETFERKSQNILRHDKVNKLKELGFTTSWNITEQKKDYNALEDPHADRYFRYQSVKMHMKELKRSIAKSEINEGEKKKIARLIKEKLSDHLPAIKVAAETYNISPNELNKSQVSQKLNKEKSLTEIDKPSKKHKKKKNKHLLHNETDFSLNEAISNFNLENPNRTSYEESGIKEKARTENNTRQKSQNELREQDKKEEEKKEYLKKQQEELHRKKHEEFIAFITKKRENLESVNKIKE